MLVNNLKVNKKTEVTVDDIKPGAFFSSRIEGNADVLIVETKLCGFTMINSSMFITVTEDSTKQFVVGWLNNYGYYPVDAEIVASGGK